MWPSTCDTFITLCVNLFVAYLLCAFFYFWMTEFTDFGYKPEWKKNFERRKDIIDAKIKMLEARDEMTQEEYDELEKKNQEEYEKTVQFFKKYEKQLDHCETHFDCEMRLIVLFDDWVYDSFETNCIENRCLYNLRPEPLCQYHIT